jgi:hypothetical protein
MMAGVTNRFWTFDDFDERRIMKLPRWGVIGILATSLLTVLMASFHWITLPRRIAVAFVIAARSDDAKEYVRFLSPDLAKIRDSYKSYHHPAISKGEHRDAIQTNLLSRNPSPQEIRELARVCGWNDVNDVEDLTSRIIEERLNRWTPENLRGGRRSLVDVLKGREEFVLPETEWSHKWFIVERGQVVDFGVTVTIGTTAVRVAFSTPR